MKKCKNCKQEIDDDALVCPYCGCVAKKRNKNNKVRSSNPMSSGIMTEGNQSTKNPSKQNSRFLLWILGWLFVFPVPLTILLSRNKKGKIIKILILAVVWLFYLLFISVIFFDKSDTATSDQQQSVESSRSIPGKMEENPEVNIEENNSIEENIKKISISGDDEITIKVGDSTPQGHLEVEVESRNDFIPDDVVLISENPEIAEIVFSEDSSATNLNYYIIGVGGGETNVYAQSKNGSIKSQPIHVVVLEPVEVETIELQGYKSDLVLGETTTVEALIEPNNAEDKILTWRSSNDEIATVDSNGNIKAVGGGTATIMASSSNGVEASFDVNVDGTKRLMTLNVKHPRQDDLNVGNEWRYNIQVNGERPSNIMEIGIGDTISFFAEITEEDSDPDIGSASADYTVTEEAFEYGFWVSMDLYVTENGGRYAGESAYFVITYTFTPIE